MSGDPLLGEIVEMFVEEMPQRTARLQAWFDQREWHALRLGLRQLSQSAGRHGFDQLLTHAAAVESKLTRRAPTVEVGQALEELLAQCGRITATGR